jgi:hypothetical protein
MVERNFVSPVSENAIPHPPLGVMETERQKKIDKNK